MTKFVPLFALMMTAHATRFESDSATAIREITSLGKHFIDCITDRNHISFGYHLFMSFFPHFVERKLLDFYHNFS